MDRRFSWVVGKGLQSTAPSYEWVKVLHLCAYDEGKHHCLEQELGIFCAEVNCWLIKWCLSQMSQTHSAGFCFLSCCAVGFPFSTKKANPMSQNGLFAFPVLCLVFWNCSWVCSSWQGFCGHLGWWSCLPHAPLLLKFVNQASMAATQPWLFSGLYLPLNGWSVPQYFLPLLLVFGLGVWSPLWSNLWLFELAHVTGRVDDECPQVFALVCSWAGMGALGLLVCFNIQHLVMVHPDCRKWIEDKLSGTGNFSGEEV